MKDHASMMTPLPAAWAATREAGGRAAAGEVTMVAPVIVLTYPDSDPGRLVSLLSAGGELACTSWTGLLPLCHHAQEVWRQLEGGGSELSPFACAWVRNQMTAIVGRILAGSGRPRWCEVTGPHAAQAETFLSLFPATRFVCLHRGCGDVIRAAISASRWGVAGTEYQPYLAAYPGSTVAALAAYWVGSTQALLAFERDHPQACLRVRSEDLAADPRQMTATINSFLGLPAVASVTVPQQDQGAGPPPAARAFTSLAHIPADQIPPGLAAQVDDLLGQLDYQVPLAV